MRFHRPQRVSDLIIEELNKLIAHEIEFEPGVLVTITDVAVARRLDTAKVKISVIPPEKTERVLEILQKFRGRLQHWLWKKINIRPMPRIEFGIDPLYNNKE